MLPLPFEILLDYLPKTEFDLLCYSLAPAGATFRLGYGFPASGPAGGTF